jgi:cytochrome bd ubiquinol oxidase subunit II
MDILPVLWMLILVLAITLYVLLDGFSLGIGILFPFARSDADRGLMMGSVTPVWDGNQTWLVGGGAALFAAFPKAFNLLLSALYLPLTLMLVALVFRGCAFEFRFKAEKTFAWNIAFAAGSLVAAFCQGLVLGTYVQGFEYDGTRLVVGHWHFPSPG